jgi:NitT/TauT family transport system ATP-binding protein
MKTEGGLLQMRQVRYTYPGWPSVVDGVDWDIPCGEIHCLVGRSGCGKTTLLKLAAGLLQPQTGTVLWSATPVLTPQADMGFVFQSPTLLDWLSGLDNVLLPIALHRKPTDAERAHAHDLLERVGLAERMHQRPGQLSGGQQSRLAIARALVTQPRILLMDEPFAALDAITREELQNDLLAVCHAQRTSIFFVTHDMTEAVYLADRVAVMAKGRIQHDVRIDLPRPRPGQVRYGPRFNALCAELRAVMDGAF